MSGEISIVALVPLFIVGDFSNYPLIWLRHFLLSFLKEVTCLMEFKKVFFGYFFGSKRRRKGIVNESIRASDILYSLLHLTNTVQVTMRRERTRMHFEPLIEKVLLNEKYCIKNYTDFIILKSDIELIWNDHNPKNNFWALRFLFSDRVTYFNICLKCAWKILFI